MNPAESAPTPVRLLVLSDLHLNFALFSPPAPSAYDIAILAGDICPGPTAVSWATRKSTFAGKPVVFVPGNHEFYGSERHRTLELLRERAAGSNVHVLDRGEVTLHGIRFLGATLWTDFALDVDRGTDVAQAMRAARHGLNDFAGQIRERVASTPGQRLFTPLDALHEHELSRAWLQERLEEPATAVATVVVTHHAPSGRSMAPIYERSRLNPCFYSELSERFFQSASLWVHGHTHSSSDYMHHGTRVVANPHGYVSWDGKVENSRFQPDLVITVDQGGRRG